MVQIRSERKQRSTLRELALDVKPEARKGERRRGGREKGVDKTGNESKKESVGWIAPDR